MTHHQIGRDVYTSEAGIAPYTVKSITIMPYSNGFSAIVKGSIKNVEDNFETRIGPTRQVIDSLIQRIQTVSKVVSYKNMQYNLIKEGVSQFAEVLTGEVGKPELPQNNMYSLDEFINTKPIEL